MIHHGLYYLLYQPYVSSGLFRHHLYAFLQTHWDKVPYSFCIFISVVLPFDSSSVIWGHSCRLLYSWNSLYLVPYYTCSTLIKAMRGWCFFFVCYLPLSSKFPLCDICLMMCLRLITSVHTYVLFCASWLWFLDMQFFCLTFLVACHLTLVCIRGGTFVVSHASLVRWSELSI